VTLLMLIMIGLYYCLIQYNTKIKLIRRQRRLTIPITVKTGSKNETAKIKTTA